MKPKRNYVHCLASNKTKVLFESKSKADNFIKYNSQEILEENGKAPVRSYYCQVCVGYHVTSNPSKEAEVEFNLRDQRIVESLKRNKEKIAETAEFKRSLKEIDSWTALATIMLIRTEIEDAEDKLDLCDLCFDGFFKSSNNPKAIRRRDKVLKARSILDEAKMFSELSEQQMEEYIDQNYKTSMKTHFQVLNNILVKRRVLALLNINEGLLEENNYDGIEENVMKCFELINKIVGDGSKKLCSNLRQFVNEQHNRLKGRLKESTSDDNGNAVTASTDEIATKPTDTIVQDVDYKSNVLYVIDKIEAIQKAFDDKDYDECENLLEAAYFVLEENMVRDDNTQLLRSQLDVWGKCISDATI